ncbi:hypothetical protein CRG98_001115 [Punica granatum]|uniref:Uncharacterized protein n=1 Tax=Punica granatum TaxID=22663 RepID=A0A2I0LCS0_PUNGR|nr:hypothetical protein CRG98_001115 [Punica granatum]
MGGRQARGQASGRRAGTRQAHDRRARHAAGAQARVGRPSVHSSPCNGGRVKAAGGLPAKVGMTRWSCGVGGRDGRPLVIARLAMER